MENNLIRMEMTSGVAVIIFLKDEVGVIENENFKRFILDLIGKGNKKLLIDLSQVKFISSIVLASLISCLKKIKLINGVMKLCCMNEKIKSVFYVTELYKIFDIYDTKNHALDTFPK